MTTDWTRFSNPTSKLYEYALTLRPVSHVTVPAGYVAFRNDPKWPHGVVQYSKPLSRLDIKHFDLEPLDPKDPINLIREMDAFHDVAMQEFSDKDIIVLPTSYGKISLTRSARPDAEFQVTHWREGQPTGHEGYDDFDEAIRAMYPGADVWRDVWERRELV